MTADRYCRLFVAWDFGGFHRGLYEDEGTTTIRNARNYLAIDMSNSLLYLSL